jgi:hypothetical protein
MIGCSGEVKALDLCDQRLEDLAEELADIELELVEADGKISLRTGVVGHCEGPGEVEPPADPGERLVRHKMCSPYYPTSSRFPSRWPACMPSAFSMGGAPCLAVYHWT